MERIEIKTFIEVMESMGDRWIEEDVERVYGNSTLADALIDRQQKVSAFLDYIKKDFIKEVSNPFAVGKAQNDCGQKCKACCCQRAI